MVPCSFTNAFNITCSNTFLTTSKSPITRYYSSIKIFLKWCYRVNTGMYMVKSASAQPNLLLSKINATEIYVPDIMLQKQFTDFVKQTDKSKVVPPMDEQSAFVEFVHQVDKSKVVVQKALDEAQTLFDSLMQEYFG